jgi:hypothetical protein
MIPGLVFPSLLSAQSTPPLDLIATSPTVALGFRRLRTAYAGSCFQVRRSSDSALQNIGFTVNEADTAAETAFVTTNSGSIATWYNQASGGINYTQATAASQPRRINAGTADTLNGFPTAIFDGTDDLLDSTAILSNIVSASAYTVIFLARPTAGTTGANIAGDRSVISDTSAYLLAGFAAAEFRGGHYTSTYETVTRSTAYPETGVYMIRFGGGNLEAFRNGGAPNVLTGRGNIGVLTGAVRIGRGLSIFHQGGIQELFVFNTALSNADANILGADMATRGGISWSNI